MASQVRGSAVVTAVIVIGLCMALHGGIAHAKTFIVGDDAGWTFNVEDWTKGKTFAADDTLVFKYNKDLHNVVLVDENGYKTCTASGKEFPLGNNEIKLARGQYYFICGVPGHCDRGQKIAVTAN
ncbi:hypothetical protein EV2_045522 [Malus domestica]|uniref:Basic blue protein n=1 Tax=Malus domestica TaxID=3750 RepID=A0A498JC67_MALDO|nr:hypothetical protein DVH24_033283 [Malus domestica]